MKLFKITCVLFVAINIISCASGYKTINPNHLNYKSSSIDKGVTLEYKYDLLNKKYRKKEVKNDVRLLAIKLTNNSNTNLTFGKDVKLVYENGSEVITLETERVFKILKQKPASYLWYLLLTPLQFTKTETNGFNTKTSSTPIGLAIGPGIAGGNMIVAGSANKKFKNDLFSYDIDGMEIKKGETVVGLVGIRTANYEAIKVKVTE